jgi:hypothetical protein
MAFVIGILILMIAATTIIGATWLALTDRASAPPMPPRGAARRPSSNDPDPSGCQALTNQRKTPMRLPLGLSGI